MPRDDDEIEHNKRVLRSMQDADMLRKFEFHGLCLAEMDRAELLGVICLLCKYMPRGVVDASGAWWRPTP